MPCTIDGCIANAVVRRFSSPCAMRFNPRELRVYPHLRGGLRFHLVWGGCGTRNSLCGQLNVNSMHVKVAWTRNSMLQRACVKRAQRHSPVVARPLIGFSRSQWILQKIRSVWSTCAAKEQVVSIGCHVVNSRKANLESTSVNNTIFHKCSENEELKVDWNV